MDYVYCTLLINMGKESNLCHPDVLSPDVTTIGILGVNVF